MEAQELFNELSSILKVQLDTFSKLEMMQKLLVVSWLRVTLPDLDEDDDDMICNYEESRMYFRYRPYKEVFQLFAKKHSFGIHY